MVDYEKMYSELMARIKDNLGVLRNLLDELNGHWQYEDIMYRYYHNSFKVQWAKSCTLKAYEALKCIQDPERGMNPQFELIVKEGLTEIDKDINKEWDKTRKWIEALLHSKYFLEMVVKYGEKYEEIPQTLDSGLAAVLELYNMR